MFKLNQSNINLTEYSYYKFQGRTNSDEVPKIVNRNCFPGVVIINLLYLKMVIDTYISYFFIRGSKYLIISTKW